MRILRVADVADNRTGGMARFVHFMSDELIAAGHEVDFIFANDLNLRIPVRARRFCVPIQIVRLVRSRLRAGRRYDAVEIHEPSAAAYAAARLIDRRLPPLIVISHGVEARARREMLRYLVAKGAPISLKARFGYLLTTLWQSNFALRYADQVVLSTTEDRDYLVRERRIPHDRVTIVNGGVGEPFQRISTGASPSAGVIFFASWIDRKGVRDAVPVLTRLVRDFPGVRVTIAGCGRSVEAVLADFPAESRAAIRVVPYVRGDESLLAEYRTHSVYFAPSVFEGQLLTMLEAAAAGLAPVCTATGGMKDFVRHGENGLLASVGDSDGLAAAIARLISDPATASRFGAQAQLDARQYTWKRSAQQFATGVEAAIRRSRPRRTCRVAAESA